MEIPACKRIELPWPSKDLTPHAEGHWRPKAKATADARQDARIACLETPRIKPLATAQIVVSYWPKRFQGDVHNMHGRMKAYIDGIADAMGCDDRDFHVHFPTEWAGKSPRGKVVFHVEQPA